MKIFEKQLNFDLWLLGAILALNIFGLVMVYSTSSILAQEYFQNPYFFLKRHIIWLALGMSLMFSFMHIDHHRLRIFAFPLVLFSLLLLTSVFFFPEVRGAHRWLRFGPIQFQPSELAKLSLVIYLAHLLDKRQKKLKYFFKGIFPYLSIIGAVVGLVLLEPDFGGALSIALLAFVMLYTAGARLSYLLGTALLSAPLVLYFLASEEYRWQRLIAFLNPWQYAKSAGFQLVQSFLAFGSGGLFGVGLGMSHQKLFYLPDAHTDFIFSVIGEELGWVGVMAVIIIFGIFITRGILVAIFSPSKYSCYLALGLTAMIGLSAVVNMAVVTGLLPTKGLVLPFLSYGGSSLVINLLACGILLNISAKRFRR